MALVANESDISPETSLKRKLVTGDLTKTQKKNRKKERKKMKLLYHHDLMFTVL